MLMLDLATRLLDHGRDAAHGHASSGRDGGLVSRQRRFLHLLHPLH